MTLISGVWLGRNRVLEDGVTIEASSEASASLSAENLRIEDPNMPWRSAGIASETLRFVFPMSVPMRHVALIRIPKVSVHATWRVQAGSSVGVYETDTGTMKVWRQVYKFGYAPFGFYPFGGFPPASLKPWISARADLGARAVRDVLITIEDPENAHGYMEVGVVYIDRGVNLQRAVQFGGFAPHWPEAGLQVPTDGGGVRVARRTPFKVHEYGMMLRRNELFGAVGDQMQLAAEGRYALFLPFPGAGEPIDVRSEAYGPATVIQRPTLTHYDIAPVTLQVRSA